MLKSRYSLLAARLLTAVVICGSTSVAAAQKTIAERLGYPADAKLLILHADDLALAHSVDTATFAALDQHAVSSASIMVPCPWLTEVAAYAQQHPDADLGLHLTLTSEWEGYRWGPVAPRDIVRGLLDGGGYLPREGIWPRASAEDVEREIRAQLDHAIEMGIHPTHLDSHMGTLSVSANPRFFAALVKVAHQYGVPLLAVRVTDERAEQLKMLAPNDIVLDDFIMAEPSVPAAGWKDYYTRAVQDLQPGVTEIVVHLGHNDSELQGITEDHINYGAAWRQRDFDVVTSPEFKRALQQNHVILVGWKDLKRVM
jgi:chitin disaccharide deacetylase